MDDPIVKPRFQKWEVAVDTNAVTRELEVEVLMGFTFSSKEAMVTGARERLQSYLAALRLEFEDTVNRWVRESI